MINGCDIMLKPNTLSKKETSDILSLISLLALNPKRIIYEEQTSSYDKYISKKINNFLNKSNINQYNLPTLNNTKIILSKKVYKSLLKIAKKTNRYKTGEEFGCYLFGHKEHNTIYFDTLSKHKSPKAKNKFKTTPLMQKEINTKMHQSNINFICHVHTHPNNINTYGCTPSNQDLYTYAWLQEQFSINDINFIGALITPPDYQDINFNDICFIFYNKENKKFYKIINIYYEDNKVIPLKKASINNELHPILLNLS